MDAKLVMLACLVLAAIILSVEAGKHKKVVIHVPYKVKKIKHTHTVYKTIHHHGHGHGGGHGHGHGHGHGKKHSEHEEEHEHFHHHGDVHGHHSIVQPVFSTPDFAPHVSAPHKRLSLHSLPLKR